MLRTLATSTFENHDDDSIERITVLGNQLNNPYLIPNMQQAYANLGITNVAVNVTNLYVRFKPSNVDQLDVLTTAMEAQNLELFDTPVDYDVIYEGDYYQDPSVSQEDITWQYAVVPPNFQSPSGVQYEVLAQIHIPGNDYTAVETEAERLAEGSGVYPNSVKRSLMCRSVIPIIIGIIPEEAAYPTIALLVTPGTEGPVYQTTRNQQARPHRQRMQAYLEVGYWFMIRKRILTDL